LAIGGYESRALRRGANAVSPIRDLFLPYFTAPLGLSTHHRDRPRIKDDLKGADDCRNRDESFLAIRTPLEFVTDPAKQHGVKFTPS